MDSVAPRRGVAHRPDAEAELAALRAELSTTRQQLAETQHHLQAQLASEQRLQHALQASGAGVWVVDLFTHALYCDPRARQLLGLPAHHAAATLADMWAHTHPDDQPAVDDLFEEAVRAKKPFEAEFRVHDAQGGWRYVAASGCVVFDANDEPLNLTGLLRDITERRLAQQQLAHKNRVLDHILHHLPVVFSRLDAEGRYLELLGAGLRRLGLADNQLVGQRGADLFPALVPAMQQLLAGETRSFTARLERQGQPVYFQVFAFADEPQQCHVVFAIDATDSEIMRARLQAEKDFTDSLLDHSADGIVAFNPHGQLTAWNRRIAQLSGRPAAAVLGTDMYAHFPFGPDSVPGQAIDDVLHGSHQPRFNLPFEFPPGTHYEVSVMPLPGPGGPAGAGGLLVVRDVTERRRLADQATRLKLRQQQEVLAAILHTQEEERRRIAEALHNGVGQLLYATKLSLENRASGPSLADGHNEALGLLKEAIRATRTISFELTPRILEDFGLQFALEELVKRIPQLTLTLLLHVHGLTPERLARPVEIAVYRIVQELVNNILKHAHASEAAVHVVREGAQVHISVEDNGQGFDASQLDNAPLRGIGLAGVRNRVDLLAGTLHVDSRLGRGTIVSIELPIA